MRTVSIGLLLLWHGLAMAQPLEIPFHFDLPGTSSHPMTDLWNRAQPINNRVDGPLVVPVLVLLPPDTEAVGPVSVSWLDCEWSPVQDMGTFSPLYALDSGQPLPWISAVGDDSVARYPVQREGAAPLLPLLLKLDHPITPLGPVERCLSGRVSLTAKRGQRSAGPQGDFLPDRWLPHALNAWQRAHWFEPYEGGRESHDYLVVARQSFVDASQQLDLFLEWKTSQGYSPLLVPFEEMVSEMSSDDAPLERPEILRGWLQKHYEELGLAYVLIIGSPNSESEEAIPMKQCWPSKDWEDPSYSLFDVPTDMYYADLTGNWNPDGDELWCELEDFMKLPEEPEGESEGERFDGVDLVPEVLVGRIPHFGKLPNYADGILERTRLYQQGLPENWHNRVLLPSPQVCFPDGNYIDGSLVSQYLIDHSLVPHAYRHTTLGEWDGDLKSAYPGDDRLDMFTMPDYYNLGYGTVFWCAHGNQEVVVRNTWWYDANANGLPEQEECDSDHFVNVLFGEAATDQFPAIIFQASCLTADPAVDGNLTHTLLQRVAVNNIASTRLTLGLGSADKWEPSPFSPGGFTLGVYFVHTLTTKHLSVAESFHAAQNTLGYGVQPWTFKIRLEFNVYGDPTTRLPGCDGDDDCDDGDLCNGLEICAEGACKRGVPHLCQPETELPQCQEYGCDPVDGCTYRDKPNHTPCSDDDPCTTDDFCYDGDCVVGDPKSCPSATEVCWVGYCDGQTGACMFGPLDDDSSCLGPKGSGRCTQGQCLPIEPEITPELTPDLIVVPDVTEDAGSSNTPARAGGGCTASHGGAAPVAGLLVGFLLLAVGISRRRPTL